MPGDLQVEEVAEVVGAVVFIGRALADRENARLSVLRRVARLNAFRFDFVCAHRHSPFVFYEKSKKDCYYYIMPRA